MAAPTRFDRIGPVLVIIEAVSLQDYSWTLGIYVAPRDQEMGLTLGGHHLYYNTIYYCFLLVLHHIFIQVTEMPLTTIHSHKRLSPATLQNLPSKHAWPFSSFREHISNVSQKITKVKPSILPIPLPLPIFLPKDLHETCLLLLKHKVVLISLATRYLGINWQSHLLRCVLGNERYRRKKITHY